MGEVKCFQLTMLFKIPQAFGLETCSDHTSGIAVEFQDNIVTTRSTVK